MPSGLIHRILNGQMAESEVNMVLPRDNPHKTPVKAVHPTLFSIEATANEDSTSDEGESVLLGIKNISWTSGIQEPKYPRWMHLSHDDIEFKTFVRHALNGYGLKKEADTVLTSSAFNRLVSTLEKSAFQGKRFGADHGSMDVQLPGQETELKINFMAVPYFSLQKALRRNESQRSKLSWVQPLVQSAYHLDSSAARENQQSVRRLYSHVTEVIHVPQLWILNIGDKFIATCSPTSLYNDQRSAITTRIMGRDPFPPIIRVTLNSGLVFDLDRNKCAVWFKFNHIIKTTIKASLNTTIDQKDCIYTLQIDNSSIDARRWQSLLESHSENDPLLILLTIGSSDSHPERTLVTIPLEGKYRDSGEKDDASEYPTASTEELSPKTLDEYKLPYYWDSPRPGEDRKIIIAQRLSDLDRKILLDHTRRTRAMDDSDCPSPRERGDNDIPYYIPPPYVLEAAQAQGNSEDAKTQDMKTPTETGTQAAAGKLTQPIFTWPIKKENPCIDVDEKYDPYSRSTRERQRPMRKIPEVDISPANNSTPTQRMKALLAQIHREILFSTDTQSSRNYNSLSLKTRSDVDSEIQRLRESGKVNSHILALFSSFARHVGYIMDYFIDKEYDCVVKGKVWAAIYGLVQSTTSSSDALFTFHCEIFSIPVRKLISHIEELRDGLSGAEEYYIPNSMVKAFIQIVFLLADSASEATRLLESDNDGESRENDEKAEDKNTDPSAWPEFLDHSVYANQDPGPPLRIIERAHIPVDRDDEDDIPPPRRRYTRSEDSSTSGRGRRWRTRRELPFDVNNHVDQITGYLDDARHECCAMFGSKDEDKSTYNGVDCGRIVSLIMDSVLRGHSTCGSIPVLDIEEIYTTYTTSLQLEARNKPSKGLLMDINLLREELEIITKNISHQYDLLTGLCKEFSTDGRDTWEIDMDDNTVSSIFESLYSTTAEGDFVVNMSTRKKLNEIQANLLDWRDVFEELTTRVDRLESQIVQRVDIIQEDHGKAILIFTIVSTIFLPMSFVTSYLGMNTSDIRDMEPSQALFWQAAAPFTVVVILAVLLVAYNANRIQGWLPRGPAFS